jgi:isoleucyl-tRNA synthetase
LLNYINIRPFDFTTQRNYGVILQFNNVKQTYQKIRKLMNQYNFIDSYLEDLKELEAFEELEDYDETIFDKFFIIELSMFILKK